MKKDIMIAIKVSKDDKRMIEFLRAEHNINISSFIRSCIINKYNELNKIKEEGNNGRGD